MHGVNAEIATACGGLVCMACKLIKPQPRGLVCMAFWPP